MARYLSAAQLAQLTDRLPQDRPFTARKAAERDVSSDHLRRLVSERLLARPMRGVYHRSDLVDDIELRLRCVALVVPSDCVVTDRTAAWIWCGERALAPHSDVMVPPISVFAPPGRRLRRGLVHSGERRLARSDVVEISGVLVTTPLRTACDLGRCLHADQALAAMDSLAGLRTFSVDELGSELGRFKGYRGIVQARALAPFVDPGSGSQFESIARKRWLDAGLPRPQCQCPVDAPAGGVYFVDFGLPDELFGVEYFGEEFHGEARRSHDEDRLAWLREEQGWTIVVARRHNVSGPRQDLEVILRVEWQRRVRSRRTVGTDAR